MTTELTVLHETVLPDNIDLGSDECLVQETLHSSLHCLSQLGIRGTLRRSSRLQWIKEKKVKQAILKFVELQKLH